MENIQKIYESNTKQILGANIDYFQNFRHELIKNFNLDNRIIKNNESIKFIDPNVLKNINFSINNNQTSNYKNLTDHKYDSSLTIKNGLHYTLMNIDNCW